MVKSKSRCRKILDTAILGWCLCGGDLHAEDSARPSIHEVTLEGNVLCNRATDSKDWFWDTNDGDHTPVIFAVGGTVEVAERLNRIMKDYPERGLGVDEAIRVQDEFDAQLKYWLVPGPTASKIHKQVEAGSQVLALTGTLAERGGKRWITVTSFAASLVKYPAPMMASDRALRMPEDGPLVLKIKDNLTLKCVPVPAGRFLQGSPFYQQRYQDEYPHEVVITKPYYMSEIPITQEIFESLMGKNPSTNEGKQLPVDCAPYAEIVKFCEVLSARSGRVVRLPTDAEWEYAARVGTSNPCFSGKYRDQTSETGGKQTKTPVRTKQANAWGLFDMLSEGWQITGDFKSDNARVKQIDPRGPPETDSRVHRDGSGRLHKTRGGPHYDHHRPNIHGAATPVGTLWEGGLEIFRVVVEASA